MTGIDEALKNAQKDTNIIEVEAGRGFVEEEERRRTSREAGGSRSVS